MTQTKQPKTGSFTPGPYEVVKLQDGGVGVGKQGLGTLIATFHDYVEHENGQEAEPNARFYKAAPEMYELLGKLLEGNGVCVHNQDPTEFPHTCYEPLICEEARRIKAAIDGEG